MCTVTSLMAMVPDSEFSRPTFTVSPEVSAFAPEAADVSLPVLAPHAPRAAEVPRTERPVRRPRLLMLRPDMRNLLAQKGS